MPATPAPALFIALFSLITFSLPLASQNDSLPVFSDTISSVAVTDTTKSDSTRTEPSYLSEDAIKSKVNYKARDTIKYNFAEEKVYLYGNAIVTYENIELKAEYIELRMDSDIVFAKGLPDSSGKMVGTPEFKEGDQVFRMQKISYNFGTKKAKINDVITQEGEGYIHGKQVYKTPSDVVYIEDGLYTTCDHDHPHFQIAAKRLKIIPDDKIVARPANLVIEDVPTPILVPFGIFPNRKGGKSGFKLPVPGESTTDGFYLWNIGYYLYISERAEMLFEADIYSKGSYALRPSFNYKTRYKNSGSLNLRHKRTISGVIPEDPNYAVTKDYWMKWIHRQEPQAHPNSNFSANVDMGTQNSFRNDINTPDQGYLTNNFSSNVRYSRYMLQKKLNMSLNARHNQNNGDGTFNLLLPEGNLSLTRIYPFKTQNAVREKWFHKIGLSYTGNFRNELSMKNSRFNIDNTDSIYDVMRNGFSHSIPVSMNFKILKYLTITPSAAYNEVWSFKTLERNWVVPDTSTESGQNSGLPPGGGTVDQLNPGFERAGTYNASVGVTTKIYGMMQSKSGYFRAFRHVMTPSASFTYSPEYTGDIRTYRDSLGYEQEYSVLEGGVYGSPGGRESGKIGLSLINSFEMKVRSENDTTDGTKKIRLMENLRISTGYDMIKDSIQWDDVSLSGYTNLAKGIQLRFNSTFDMYSLATDSTGTRVFKVDKFEYEQSGKLARFTRGNIAITTSFNGGAPKKEEDGEKISTIGRGNNYVNWDIPWNLSTSYSIDYSKPQYEEIITQSLSMNGDVSVTKNWKVSFNTWYDLEAFQISYARLGIHRNLHCWEMSMEWIPIGRNNFYNFRINVKASLLQDLKLEKKPL